MSTMSGVPAPSSPTDEYHDFTASSPWEQLIHKLESKIVEWGVGSEPASGTVNSENLVPGVLKAHFEYRGSFIILSYHCYPQDESEIDANFRHMPVAMRTLASARGFSIPHHPLSLWFGVQHFLVLEPARLSGASTSETALLVGSLSLAVSNCAPGIPCFTPIGEGSRGVVVGHSTSESAYTLFESQRHALLPPTLSYLPGLVDLFKSKMALGSTSSPVAVAAKFTYKRNESELIVTETLVVDDSTDEHEVNWGAPMYPLEGLSLFAEWAEKDEDKVTDNAVHSDFNPKLAQNLSISALFKISDAPEGAQTVMSSLIDCLVDGGGLSLELALGGTEGIRLATEALAESLPHDVGAVMGVVPDSDAINQGMNLVFEEWDTTSATRRFVPCETLLERIAWLMASQRKFKVMALLWREFVRRLRWCWDSSVELQAVPQGHVDHAQILLLQKVQLLNTCIKRKKTHELIHVVDNPYKKLLDAIPDAEAPSILQDASNLEDTGGWDIDDDDIDDVHVKPISWTSKVAAAVEYEDDSSETFYDAVEDIEEERCRGVREPLGTESTTSGRMLNIPLTQVMPTPTSDAVQEQIDIQDALESVPESAINHARMHWAPLLSDMEAFKASNPGCSMEDFVMWHSPRDYVDGVLSPRMAEPGNLWRRLWAIAEGVPAAEQQPLFDHEMEGEKIMDYLENAPLPDLLHQLQVIALQSAHRFLSRTTPAVSGALSCVSRSLDHLQMAITHHTNVEQDSWSDTHSAAVHSLETAELFIHRSMVLHRLWPGKWGLIAGLLEHEHVAIESNMRQDVLACFFAEHGDMKPSTREFLLHCNAPRPFPSSPTVPHRLYAELCDVESRVCISVSTWSD